MLPSVKGIRNKMFTKTHEPPVQKRLRASIAEAMNRTGVYWADKDMNKLCD